MSINAGSEWLDMHCGIISSCQSAATYGDHEALLLLSNCALIEDLLES